MKYPINGVREYANEETYVDKKISRMRISSFKFFVTVWVLFILTADSVHFHYILENEILFLTNGCWICCWMFVGISAYMQKKSAHTIAHITILLVPIRIFVRRTGSRHRLWSRCRDDTANNVQTKQTVLLTSTNTTNNSMDLYR